MSILEELSNPIRQIDAETATNTRSERSRGHTQRKDEVYEDKYIEPRLN